MSKPTGIPDPSVPDYIDNEDITDQDMGFQSKEITVSRAEVSEPGSFRRRNTASATETWNARSHFPDELLGSGRSVSAVGGRPAFLNPMILLMSCVFLVVGLTLFGALTWTVRDIRTAEASTRDAWKTYNHVILKEIIVLSQLKGDRIKAADIAESRYFLARPDNEPIKMASMHHNKEQDFIESLKQLKRNQMISGPEREKLGRMVSSFQDWEASVAAEKQTKETFPGVLLAFLVSNDSIDGL